VKLIKDLLIPRLALDVTNFTVRRALLIIFFDTQLGSYAEASEKHDETQRKRKFSTRKFKNRKTFLKFVRAAFLALKAIQYSYA